MKVQPLPLVLVGTGKPQQEKFSVSACLAGLVALASHGYDAEKAKGDPTKVTYLQRVCPLEKQTEVERLPGSRQKKGISKGRIFTEASTLRLKARSPTSARPLPDLCSSFCIKGPGEVLQDRAIIVPYHRQLSFTASWVQRCLCYDADGQTPLS